MRTGLLRAYTGATGENKYCIIANSAHGDFISVEVFTTGLSSIVFFEILISDSDEILVYLLFVCLHGYVVFAATTVGPLLQICRTVYHGHFSLFNSFSDTVYQVYVSSLRYPSGRVTGLL